MLAEPEQRRRTDPAYRRGWNSYGLAQPAAATLSPSVAPVTSRLPPLRDVRAWNDGLRDRTDFQAWFAALSGDEHDGARYWTMVRSNQPRESCEPPGASPLFSRGCEEAKARLGTSDVRRHTQTDYWRGWNSYQGPS